MCQDGSANHGRAGELHLEEALHARVSCLVPTFAANGSLILFAPCRKFESLGR